jgi:hypothetical protein
VTDRDFDGGNAEDAASPTFWPPRRTFYLGLAVACVLAATVAAAQVSEGFLLLGALVAAVVADGFDPFSATWLGWSRRIDGRRVLVFVFVFVGALVALALFAFVIADKIYLGGS